ncbi:MAG: valine--tRNA ligase [Peptoniphilaceae bacterium]|nr:valine--tRNA ligase [Peptoniphilaceae bacterium]MDY5766679.1 valine--tRNA ligase [Peptoniphilaceae bacterium]
MKNLQKTYDPSSFEDRIYAEWERDGDFIADAKSDKKPYTIVMPPPNVTGQLHMGHAMNNTLQDILIRWKRMSGYEALWVPGTDHASISTEAKVVEKLAKEGVTKQDIGREKFVEEAWKWTAEYGGTIRKQLRKLGISCDWSRERFTLDEGLSKAVYTVFKALYDEGKIYRGDRIVNWCPSCGTAISDAEVDHIDEEGHLWYIRYPFKDHPDRFVTIATTRPETLLGDLAVAVHPEDERFSDLLGEMLLLPLVGREIPLIADEYVDREYGTGAVKITPSHDPNDFEVGARHNLGQCIVIDEQAKIVEGYAPYSGLDRYEARKRIVSDLESRGLLDHIETLSHAVGHCERCHTVIEPLLSKQWFVAMKEYIEPAREALEKGELKLVPNRFDKIYLNWIDNIHDWTISRQLWWGHRIPVWYCRDCGEIIVETEAPGHCPKCGSDHLEQDPDTLDTWFSSALWAFSTLGWPEKTEDFEKFFPTDTLVTGYDILFFWVLRMVFSTLHFTGQVPFHHVYFNGIVRDEQGRKMSKSLGNGIDPLEAIAQYGADALRFTLVTGNTPGNDTRYSEKRVEASRNFANKLWNATRFVLMNLEEDKEYLVDPELLEAEDRWILSTLNETARNVNRNLDRFEIGLAAAELYDFIWFRFCDWYIEFVKPRLYGEDARRRDTALGVLMQCIASIVKLLHPFMPFITEEIWQTLPFTKGKAIHAEYPQYDPKMDFSEDVESIEMVISAITAIRNERQQRNIAPSKKSKIVLYSSDASVRKQLQALAYEFENLASASEVQVVEQDPKPEDAAQIIQDKLKIYLPLKGLIDYNEELKKLAKELENAQNEIARAEKKLANPGFSAKAPENVINKEKEKIASYSGMIPELEKAIADVRKMIEN